MNQKRTQCDCSVPESRRLSLHPGITFKLCTFTLYSLRSALVQLSLEGRSFLCPRSCCSKGSLRLGSILGGGVVGGVCDALGLSGSTGSFGRCSAGCEHGERREDCSADCWACLGRSAHCGGAVTAPNSSQIDFSWEWMMVSRAYLSPQSEAPFAPVAGRCGTKQPVTASISVRGNLYGCASLSDEKLIMVSLQRTSAEHPDSLCQHCSQRHFKLQINNHPWHQTSTQSSPSRNPESCECNLQENNSVGPRFGSQLTTFLRTRDPMSCWLHALCYAVTI